MDKKVRYWPAFVLGIMVIGFFIMTRPVTFEKMNHIEEETEIINCIVRVTWWDRGTPASETITIHQEQFEEIAALMKAFKYCKVWDKKYHSSPDGRYYTIDIEYLVKGETLFQRMSLTRDGYIYIDDETLPYQEIHGNTEYIVLKLESYLKGIMESDE
ncbi:MAG: hypothetical protein E6370_09010 [Clostridiales bacterium]|nr:hypothetical protein [Clostridiales bacterium]MDU6974451.1 hypothetical protein [Clostridiales bacterium]